jgi:glycosyltransferase involved in cell wall biosynthesis
MGSSQRILYVDLAPTVGGSVISLYELVKGLDRSRYEPHVILRASNSYIPRFRDLGVALTLWGGTNSTAAIPADDEWSGLRHSRLAEWLKGSGFGEQFVHAIGFYVRTWPRLRQHARELAEVIRTISPGLVHLNDVVCVSRAGIMAARAVGVPVICHARAIAPHNHFDRWLARSLRGIIYISRAVECHERNHGLRVANRWIVYNGLDLDEFRLGPDRGAVRAELGLDPGDQVVGCVGRLIAWKGQRIFLRALARLVPDRPKLRGLIVGAPEQGGQGYANELAGLSHSLGLDQLVRFAGFRDDIPRLLSGLDILVHASTSPEPFGRVIIEGMAAGAAVIGTNAGAVPEIITEGVTGMLVPPGDDEALASAIAQLLNYPEKRQALRHAARRAVEVRFTTALYVQGVEKVYEEILP